MNFKFREQSCFVLGGIGLVALLIVVGCVVLILLMAGGEPAAVIGL